MEEIWVRIENWLEINAPNVLQVLQPGASDTQIKELEDFLYVQLPEDFKSSYRIHNGQSADSWGFIGGQREFLSLEGIRREWAFWRHLFDDGAFQEENGQDQGSNPDSGIYNVFWHPKWIPFVCDDEHSSECLDLEPDVGGTIGQIVTMSYYTLDRKIVAASFRTWLRQYADSLEAGQFIFSDQYNWIVPVKNIGTVQKLANKEKSEDL
jgi:cell wall assembly regulator SMI1